MPQALIGQLTQLTENVEIYLSSTGSNLVDTFNIEIYKWDIGTNSEILSGSYATGVTPTTLSSYNGHSLVDGWPDGGSGFGYGISGVTYDCTKVRLITSGSFGHCTGGYQDADLTNAAIKIYNPGAHSTWTITYSGTSAAYPMIYQNGSSTGAHLTVPDYPFKFITLPWGNANPYLTYTASTAFDITHIISKKVSDDSTITGDWANGPLVNMSVVNDTSVNDGQHFAIYAEQRSGVSQTFPGEFINSTYRITWNDSGNFFNLNFYWETDTYSQ